MVRILDKAFQELPVKNHGVRKNIQLVNLGNPGVPLLVIKSFICLLSLAGVISGLSIGILQTVENRVLKVKKLKLLPPDLGSPKHKRKASKY